ncbi:MAG: Fic/DOC family N-terminal domain-containing protein [Bacteroidia bacterium]
MKNFTSGRVVNQGYYAAFIPELIDRVWELDDMVIITLLTEADRELGRLDMYSQYVNIEHYISLHLAKEATLSSKIEGTRTQIEEVFMDEAVIAQEKRNDWQEVQNYITAMKITMAQ